MSTPVCVEMKNRIQEDILRDYTDVPKEEWSRKQEEDLAKSQSPIAEYWRRLEPVSRRYGGCVAEKDADYRAKK